MGSAGLHQCATPRPAQLPRKGGSNRLAPITLPLICNWRATLQRRPSVLTSVQHAADGETGIRGYWSSRAALAPVSRGTGASGSRGLGLG
jgi:hypothetical protein